MTAATPMTIPSTVRKGAVLFFDKARKATRKWISGSWAKAVWANLRCSHAGDQRLAVLEIAGNQFRGDVVAQAGLDLDGRPASRRRRSKRIVSGVALLRRRIIGGAAAA